MTRRRKSPLVSVIVATYNRAETLAYTLSSIRSQTMRDFEVLVVGDACTDQSARIVRGMHDSRFRWFNLRENSGGQWGPNNEGLRRARGTYVAYLGHDDLWFPWHLHDLILRAESTRSEFVFGLGILIGSDGSVEPTGYGFEDDLVLREIPPSSWLHRRTLVDRIGGWRKHRDLTMGTDADFILRARKEGCVMELSPRLSLLKFPSHLWKTYKMEDNFPQEMYWKAMQRSQTEVYEGLIERLGFEISRRAVSQSDVIHALRRKLAVGMQRFYAFYGRERWPVGPYLRFRFRHHRKRISKDRGLA